MAQHRRVLFETQILLWALLLWALGLYAPVDQTPEQSSKASAGFEARSILGFLQQGVLATWQQAKGKLKQGEPEIK